MSRRSYVGGVALLLAPAVFGACLAAAAPRRAPMSHDKTSLPVALHAGPTVPDIGGDLVAFGADGRWAAAEGLRLHLGQQGRLLGTVAVEHGAPRGPLQFSSDGQALSWGAFRVTVGADRASAVLTPPAPDLMAALEAALPGAAGELEISVATRSADDAIRVIVGRMRPSMQPGGPGGPLRAAAVSLVHGVSHVLWQGAVHAAPVRVALAGDLVAIGGAELLVADARSGRVLFHELHPHAGTINALVWSPGGDRLYTAAADGGLSAWSLPKGERAWSRPLSKEPLRGLVIDRAGKLLAACGWDDHLYVVSTQSVETTPVSQALGGHGEALAFSPAGDRLLVATQVARDSLQFFDLLFR